jgi:hypothetical protein
LPAVRNGRVIGQAARGAGLRRRTSGTELAAWASGKRT